MEEEQWEPENRSNGTMMMETSGVKGVGGKQNLTNEEGIKKIAYLSTPI